MNNIEIIKKPDWVSWEEIQDVLWKAHTQNRVRGIIMGHQNLSGEKVGDMLGDSGIMLVAMADEQVVGTAAVKIKESNFWYGKDNYAYCCFASVLLEYEGQGIYRHFIVEREAYARKNGIDKMLFNTHPRNKRVINIALKNGYRRVCYTAHNGFSYVYLVKWLNGCPYSKLRCRYEYLKCKYFVLTKCLVKFILDKIGIS